MAGPFVGVVTLAVLLTGLIAGVVLLPFFLAGLPVLAGTPWVCIWIARAERARFALLLGAGIPAAPPPHGRTGLRPMVAPLTPPPSWRHAPHPLVPVPFGGRPLSLHPPHC